VVYVRPSIVLLRSEKIWAVILRPSLSLASANNNNFRAKRENQNHITLPLNIATNQIYTKIYIKINQNSTTLKQNFIPKKYGANLKGLSGTPLQNRVGELFSLIRLMDLYPHSYYFCTRCNCKSQVWKFTGGVYCDDCGHTGHQHFCYWYAL
jgi:hypothetical protein